MLEKPNRARGKKEVSDAQVRKAWRNDVCLCQAIQSYREWLQLTIDEQVDRIFEEMIEKLDTVSYANAVIIRAAEVYWEVTGRSPRTVGNELSARLQLGENPFITLITTLLEEEGLKSPSSYAITKVLRKRSTSVGTA